MFKLADLAKKLKITITEETIQELKNLGFKIENGIISGQIEVDGRTVDAETVLTNFVAKHQSALATTEENNLNQQNQVPTGYNTQTPFNVSVQDVVSAGHAQLKAAAQSGYNLGEAISDAHQGGLSEGYLRRTAENYRQNILFFQALDQNIAAGASLDISKEIRSSEEGKYRPSLP